LLRIFKEKPIFCGMNGKSVILERCIRCGADFDLNYDIEEEEGVKGVIDFNVELLCWKCRALKLFSDVVGRKRELNRQEEIDIEFVLGSGN